MTTSLVLLGSCYGGWRSGEKWFHHDGDEEERLEDTDEEDKGEGEGDKGDEDEE